MLPRHDQGGLAIASNDNGLFAAFRWDRIAPNPTIAGVAVAITGSIALHVVADGVLMMTRPTITEAMGRAARRSTIVAGNHRWSAPCHSGMT